MAGGFLKMASARLLDVAVAALAGSAMTFFVWAMPAEMFARSAGTLPRLAGATTAGLFTSTVLFTLFRAMTAAPLRHLTKPRVASRDSGNLIETATATPPTLSDETIASLMDQFQRGLGGMVAPPLIRPANDRLDQAIADLRRVSAGRA